MRAKKLSQIVEEPTKPGMSTKVDPAVSLPMDSEASEFDYSTKKKEEEKKTCWSKFCAKADTYYNYWDAARRAKYFSLHNDRMLR